MFRGPAEAQVIFLFVSATFPTLPNLHNEVHIIATLASDVSNGPILTFSMGVEAMLK